MAAKELGWEQEKNKILKALQAERASKSKKQQKMEQRLKVNDEKVSFLEKAEEEKQTQSVKRYWGQEFKQAERAEQ